MRIAVDIRTVTPNRSGVGNYVLHLLEAMRYLGRPDQLHYLANPVNPGLLPFQVDPARIIATGLSFESHPWGDLWENFRLPALLKKRQIEVFHAPAMLMPLRGEGFAKVVTIHDLVPFLFQDTIPAKYGLYMRWLLRQVAEKAQRVIAVSRHTAEDIKHILKVPEDRIRVVHEAARPGFAPPARPHLVDEALQRHGIRPPYVLHLGNIEPRKNLPRLVEAFLLANESLTEPATLVVAGRQAWLSGPLLKKVEKLAAGGRLIFTGYLPTVDLPLLMAGCHVFAFPSLYEGFGLPALEAMACGAPVLAGAAGSLPEVTGQAALLVDPMSVEAIAEGLAALLQSDSLRRQYSAAGLARAAHFSWQRAAEETLAVYAEAIWEA